MARLATPTKRLLVVAGLTVAVVALLIVLLLWRSDRGTRIEAVFDSTNGLVVGADVRAGGLSVGRVEKIRLAGDGYPHVTLLIGPGFRLRQGAGANLRLGSLSGEVNRHVALSQGKGPLLRDGATLGLARTDQPVEVDKLLSTLDPRTRADVRSALHGLAGSLRGRGPDLRRSLRHSAAALDETANLLGDVSADGDQLRRLVAATNTASGALARTPGATGAAVERTSSLLDHAAVEQEALGRAIAGLPAGLREPRVALDELRRSVPVLRRLVRSGRPAIAELADASPELRRLLRAARPTLAEARGLIEESPPDLARLTRLLRGGRPAIRQLDPALRLANPMLDQVRVRLPDFFSFFANWADFTSNYDANGHGARVGIVFSPAPLNTVDGESTSAGHLKRPFLRFPGAIEGEPYRNFEQTFVGQGG